MPFLMPFAYVHILNPLPSAFPPSPLPPSLLFLLARSLPPSSLPPFFNLSPSLSLSFPPSPSVFSGNLLVIGSTKNLAYLLEVNVLCGAS